MSTGFVATIAGWVTTEVGRQPYVVYGLLRTADSVPPSLTGADALTSLIGYMIVYIIIFPAGFLVMARIIRKGPSTEEPDSPIESGRPSAPVTVELRPEGGAS